MQAGQHNHMMHWLPAWFFISAHWQVLPPGHRIAAHVWRLKAGYIDSDDMLDFGLPVQ